MVHTRMPDLSDTARSILSVAERLAQTKGFNGFSYADIAEELELTKATLHYHFASKAELGRVLIMRYGAAFNAALERIETEAGDPLERYVQLFEQVLVRDRMCLCGMLAAEYSALPASMQAELRRFFDENEVWLARQLERARSSGKIHFDGSSLEAARTLTKESLFLEGREDFFEGRALLYADTMTESMRRAIDETNRRRDIQTAYNEEHGIQPQSVISAIEMGLAQILSAEYGDVMVEEAAGMPDFTSQADVDQYIEKLETEMRETAKRFEFEKAAKLRDKIKELRTKEFLFA